MYSWIVMYQSELIPKLPMRTPPPAPLVNPLAFDCLEKFCSNFPVCWQFRWSNAPPASASKSVKSATYQRLFKNLPMRRTIYSNVNILLNTTQISYVLKSCFYRGWFIAIKLLFIPESPHLTVFFKGSQMLQQNSGYRSSDPSLWSGEHLGSGIIIYSTVHCLWLFSSFLIPSPHAPFPFPPLFFQL